ncbi:Ig-like domain-containing protein [Arcanobacterium hippocoleae]
MSKLTIVSAMSVLAAASICCTSFAFPSTAVSAAESTAQKADSNSVIASNHAAAGSGTCAATAQKYPGAQVFNVLDYGADPTGTADAFAEDSQLAVQRAIAAVNARADKNTPAILCFPRGTYDLYPDKAVTRTYYVTNTVGDNQKYTTKHIAMHFENSRNVIIDGDGSLLRMHGQQTILSSVRSSRITAQNFSIDWVTPRVFEMTTTGAYEENGKVVREYTTPDGYNTDVVGRSLKVSSENSPYTHQPYWSYNTMSAYVAWTNNIESFTQHTLDLDSGKAIRTGWYWGSDDLFKGVEKVEKTSDTTYKFTYRSNANPGNLGKVFQMRTLVRDTPGMFIWESDNTTLRNLDIGYLHGFGIVSQFSDSLNVLDSHFRAPAESWRHDVGFADLIQVSGDKGKVTIEGNNFGFAHDDPINVHGTYVQLTAKNGNQGTFRYKHLETAGFPQFYTGDKVRLIYKSNMTEVPDWEGTVVDVQGPTGESYDGDLRQFKVTFDRPLPAEAQVNGVVAENVTYSPEVNISNNHFEAIATRGILVTTRKPVVLDGNTFDQMNMASIYISGDANNWYESSTVCDVAITNNTFIKPVSQTIFVDPIGTSSNTGQAVHENIRITGNKFLTNVPTTAIDAKSVKGLQISNNSYILYGLNPTLSINNAQLAVGEAARADVAGVSANSKPLYWFYSSTDVNIGDNKYGYGQNPGYGINNGMNDSDVTVSDPDVTKAGGSAGRVAYESSNPAVASVDSNGTVTALSEGTADIAAALVGETGIVRTNKVTVTVGAAASGVTTLMEPITFDAVRGEPHRVGAEGNVLTMTPAAGSEWHTGTANNILRIPEKKLALNDSVTVKLEGRTASGWEEAGLMLYTDDDNYVSIQRKHNGGTPMLRVVTENNGQANEGREVADPAQPVIWLRLTRTSAGIQGSYSLNGTEFTNLGSEVTNDAVDEHSAIALVTAGRAGAQSDSHIFKYSDMAITDTPFALTRERVPGAADSIPEGESDNANLVRAEGSIPLSSDGIDLAEREGFVSKLESSVNSVTLNLTAADPQSTVSFRLNGKKMQETGTHIEIPVTRGATVLEAYVTAPSGNAQRVYRWVFLRDGDAPQTPQPRIAETGTVTFDDTAGTYTASAAAGLIYLKDGAVVTAGAHHADPGSSADIYARPALGYYMTSASYGSQHWEHTFPEAQNPQPQIDTKLLAQAAEQAKALKPGEYTPESWQPFAEALAEAEAALSNPTSQQQINSAAEALSRAQAALVLVNPENPANPDNPGETPHTDSHPEKPHSDPGSAKPALASMPNTGSHTAWVAAASLGLLAMGTFLTHRRRQGSL